MEQRLSLQFCILYWMVGRSGNKTSTLSYCFKDKKIIKNLGAFCIHSGLCKYKHIFSVFVVMLLSNQKFDCKQHGLVIAQLCLGNLVCCLAPFNLCMRDVRQPWILQHTPPGNGSGFDNAHFTWWHENCLWCLSTTVAVVAWMVNFTSAIQKWFFKLFYCSFSTMKLVNSFLLFFTKFVFVKFCVPTYLLALPRFVPWDSIHTQYRQLGHECM